MTLSAYTLDISVGKPLAVFRPTVRGMTVKKLEDLLNVKRGDEKVAPASCLYVDITDGKIDIVGAVDDTFERSQRFYIRADLIHLLKIASIFAQPMGWLDIGDLNE